MRRTICLFTVLAAGIATPSTGRADTTEWSAAAMTCTPSSTTVAENKYITTAGGVKFKPQATGTIVFLCMVSRPMPDGDYFLSGRIAANSANHNGLEMQLRRRDKSSGSISNVMAAATVSTANQPLRRFSSQFPTEINFDFDKYVYWVQITMKRSSASGGTPPPILNAELVRVN